MRKILFLFLMTPLFTTAQDNGLLVEGVSPNLYINHKVESKENYYSIGRIYNVSPKEIAPYNNLQLEGGLSLGQQIKIPLNSTNFFQSGKPEADETFVPVYYKVKDKEGLYRVAKNHNNLDLETLKKWNNIKTDAVKNSTQLIVGYLKVKTELSSLAKNGTGAAISSNPVTVAEEKKAALPEIVTQPVIKTVPEKEKAKEIKATETKVPEIKKEAAEEQVKVKAVKDEPDVESKKAGEAGFKNLYKLQEKNAETIEASGDAGVFKSTSGWADKKYYCLFNNASPGTIIKVANAANQKSVYAKVLDLIPDIKQNDGLFIIISNAAAEALGAVEGNFNCTVSYSK
jgi:LysM repeat protein